MVELPEGVVGVLAPGHGHEAEAFAALVVVDDLGLDHGAELAEEHDEVVFPERSSSVKAKEQEVTHLKRKGMLET